MWNGNEKRSIFAIRICIFRNTRFPSPQTTRSSQFPISKQPIECIRYNIIFYSFLSPHPTPKTNSGLALLQTGPNCCGTLEHPSAFQNKTKLVVGSSSFSLAARQYNKDSSTTIVPPPCRLWAPPHPTNHSCCHRRTTVHPNHHHHPRTTTTTTTTTSGPTSLTKATK